MSDSISAAKSRRMQEAEHRDHLIKMKKLRADFDNKYNSAVKTNNALLERVQKDYELELGNLKNRTEKRLTTIRRKHENRILDEQKRLGAELEDIKRSNEDRKAELKESQQEEINRVVQTHNNNLENARRKYLSRMAKIDGADD